MRPSKGVADVALSLIFQPTCCLFGYWGLRRFRYLSSSLRSSSLLVRYQHAEFAASVNSLF